ncbi:MAG: S-adenosylmethionine:tRNA ribosyltransferase-isomerase [Bdellovibrionales bacterium]|nr:S-adenosylmethionine:tRNA ribosyltransferase-isomerase [Bdellovibrionales bacterium]
MKDLSFPVSSLDFEYPEELVATERRLPSRTLLAAEPVAREVSREELLAQFQKGDLWVVNETKVLKRRVFTAKGLEILFIQSRNEEQTEWEVLCPSSRWKRDTTQEAGGVELSLLERGRPQILKSAVPLTEAFFEENGELPLPPYIQKARGERHTRGEDEREYQSIWAKTAGSLAAPTASFHFDDRFLAELEARGVEVAKVTLHVGLGTFLPITVEDLKDHVMHAEVARVPSVTRQRIAHAKQQGGRIVAVGTTVTRTLEAMALGHFREEAAGDLVGETALLIRPGHEWRVVDVLLTNFHQPKSTLLALVAAFAEKPGVSGVDRVKAVYRRAIESKFRLFSYGDLSVWFRR